VIVIDLTLEQMYNNYTTAGVTRRDARRVAFCAIGR
jgi:hypothetical protein